MSLDQQAVEAIARRIAELLGATPASLLNAEQAAELLNVPPTWLLAEARADRIPHVRFGRYVRFAPEALRAWSDERARGPRGAGESHGGRRAA